MTTFKDWVFMESKKSKMLFYLKLFGLYFACTFALVFLLHFLFSSLLANDLAHHAGSGILSFFIGFISNGKLARTGLTITKQVIAISLFHIIGTATLFFLAILTSTPPHRVHSEYGSLLIFVDLFLAYVIYAVIIAVTIKNPEDMDNLPPTSTE